MARKQRDDTRMEGTERRLTRGVQRGRVYVHMVAQDRHREAGHTIMEWHVQERKGANEPNRPKGRLRRSLSSEMELVSQVWF